MFKILNKPVKLSSRACRPRVAKASASGAGIPYNESWQGLRFLDKLEMTKDFIFLNFGHCNLP